MEVGGQHPTASPAGPLVRGFNDFGLRLYDRLPRDRNLFFSPLSINLALSTLVPGARGDTVRELETTLGFSAVESSPAEAVGVMMQSLLRHTREDYEEDPETHQLLPVEREVFVLHVANALFGQEGYPLVGAYREMLRESFRADLFSLDFAQREAAAGRINGWVSERTRGKIEELVRPDQLTPLTRLVLTNAVYFKAEWANQFAVERTERRPFGRLGGAGSVDVDMMHNTFTPGHWRDSELGVSVVEVPYRAMSMLVLLPDEGRLSAVETALGEGLVQRTASRLSGVRIDLGLPKFELKESLQLGELLRDLGLAIAFDPTRADFSGITDHPEGLYVSR